MFEWSYGPEIFRIGFFALRWYSLMFMCAFLLGFYIMQWIFNRENKPEVYLNDLFIHVFAGTIIGARLGHCLFYDPGYYLSHPLEILQVWKGGLASHGAAIGILISLYILVKNRKGLTLLWALDRVLITVALAGFFIRMGNFFNSEILGKAADIPWSVVFSRIDMVARHPVQIYEALTYLVIFGVLFFLYYKTDAGLKSGLLCGLFLIQVFVARFFLEFLKENQSAFEQGWALNMGQLLSIPFVLIGLFFIFRSLKVSEH